MAAGPAAAAAKGEVEGTALRLLLAYELPESACRAALLRFGNSAEAALDFLLDTEEGAELCCEGACEAQALSEAGSSEATHESEDASGMPSAPATPTPEQLFYLMEGAVQGHSPTAVAGVFGMWEAEGWELANLLGHVDVDGNGWLHHCMLAPPVDLCWDPAVDVVRVLLDAQISPDVPNSCGETPLWLAVQEAGGGHASRIQLLRTLLAAGADPEHALPSGRRLLQEAADVGDTCICRVLLDAFADLGELHLAGAAALRLAALHPEVAALLRGEAARRGAGSGTAAAPLPDSAEALAAFREEVMLHNSKKVHELLHSCTSAGRSWLAQEDADGHSALQLCLLAPPSEPSLTQQIATLEVLLAAKASPNQANRSGETALLISVREAAWSSGLDNAGRCRIMRALLHAKADFEAMDVQGVTPLMEACQQDNADLATLLLSAGASPARPTGYRKTALELAPPRGSVARLLSAHFGKSSVGDGEANAQNCSTRPTGSSAGVCLARELIQAVEAHNAELVQAVLARYKAEGKKTGALLAAQDADGHSLLHLCIIAPQSHMDAHRLPETAKLLLAARADPNLTNVLGETPLLLAVREMAGSTSEARIVLTRMLMKAGASYDFGDSQDTTPLMEAAMLGDAELCEVLLDRGADMRRRGGTGLSARELAARNPLVHQVFEAQAEKQPSLEEDHAMQSINVTLRHAVTQLERVISVPSTAVICDVKKQIVRLAHRGSWRRIALLSEEGRMLHDKDHLNGRTLLIMADAKSAEATRAAEELLTEEGRWRRYSLEELQAEADRRGFFGGADRDSILASLTEVKRWETLSAKDLRAECARRGLAIDSNPERYDLLTQLKQDFGWENMQEAELREECMGSGIPLPEEAQQPQFEQAMRSRLRQASRSERLPLEQLRLACEVRNFDPGGRSREEMLAFLKSFRVLPKAKVQPKPKPRPAAAAPRRRQASAYAHEQEHERGWRRPEGSASERSPSPRGAPGDGEEAPKGLSDRVWRICSKYPNFTGSYPPEMNDWSDQDIEMYLYSNGMLKPNKNRKAPAMPKVLQRIHYRTLGLSEGSPASEVRKAYRRLALAYHPDKNPQDPETAAENFKAITEAYEALTANAVAELAG